MATYIKNPYKSQLAKKEAAGIVQADMSRQAAAILKKQKRNGKKGVFGKYAGAGLGLVAGIGLLTPFIGLPAAAAMLAKSPVLAGAAAGVGAWQGEKSKGLGAGDEAIELEKMSERAQMGLGAGRKSFGEKVEEEIGDSVSDLGLSAIQSGLTIGASVGSLAGGVQAISSSGSAGSLLSKWMNKYGTAGKITVNPGAINPNTGLPLSSGPI